MSNFDSGVTFGDDGFEDGFDLSDLNVGVQSMSSSGFYLDDIVHVLENAGIPTLAEPGWPRRGRSGGSGLKGPPRGIIVHHTASQTSAQNDVNYITYNAQYAPISQLYISREGVVHVCAGGGANHAGSGSGEWWGSSVPNDSANSYTIGIECGNNGVGEFWPEVQRRRMVEVCAILANHYDVPIDEVRAHYEWAPDRKIDPAGPPEPYMHPTDGSRRWDMNRFRADVTAWGQLPPPLPGPTEEAMILYRHADYADWFAVGGGSTKLGPETFNQLAAQGIPQVVTSDDTELDAICASASWPRSALTPL